eukprot:jgi/Phyca11/14314/fgenesh1_pg.PHYCAscaffold_7_\
MNSFQEDGAVPRKYIHELNDMVPAFEAALRSTLSTDMSLLMKLLRSSFVALLITNEKAVANIQGARTILLTPIDDGGPKKRKSLTIVTLTIGTAGGRESTEKTSEQTTPRSLKQSVADGLYTSLFTAALLLVRHLSKINRRSSGATDEDADMESIAPPKPLLQAVRGAEKSKLTTFHQEMESELVEVVRLASLLLTKWTSSLADRDAIMVVDGVRCVDEEQLVPLLAFLPPSESRSMNSNPGLGHLTLAMDFMLDQLLESNLDEEPTQTKTTKTVLANAIDACALLFLKTYLLHAELYELGKRDRNELHRFFRQFNARLSKDDAAQGVSVDRQLLEHIDKVCSV